jgi:translation initiation factor 2B subunit (eIF-2B alpha/beta/delta family)
VIKELETLQDIDLAEHYLADFKKERSELSEKIKKKSRQIITKNDEILLFSQSKRIYEFLSSVSRSTQSSCQLYIAECRPKSPGKSFFQDSFEIIDNIENNYYKTTFFPDIIMSYLFSEKKIKKVLLGAHAVFLDKKGNMTHFINTAGSLIISHLCKIYNIPLYIIAESAKEEQLQNISHRQEVELKDEESIDILKKYKNDGIHIEILNVGYDLVQANS